MEKIKRRLRLLKTDSEQQEKCICYFGLLISLGAIFFSAFGNEFVKAELIISFVIMLVCLGLLMIYNRKKLAFHRFAFLCVLFLGGLSLLIQPIVNIPDEVVHLIRAERISSGYIAIDPSQQEYETIQSMLDMEAQVGVSIVNSELEGKEIDYSKVVFRHIAASNLTFMYLPQAAGMFVAKILDLNVIWLLWLGRLGNLIWYSFLVALAIKLAPVMKIVLFMISILPMSIQQAGSVSPDASINGLSILLIGYFLYLYNKKDEKITNKQIVIFFLLAILVTFAKVTNICLAGLFLLLDLKKGRDIKKEWVIKLMIILGVISAGAIYYYYTTTFAPNLGQQTYLLENNVNSSEQLAFILSNPLLWLKNFMRSLISQSEAYVNMLNIFGWLNYGCSLLTIITVFMYGKLCCNETNIYISKTNKFLVFLMVMGTYFLTAFALYVSWSPVQGPDVLGVQGRYLIPMFALLPLLFANEKKSYETNHRGNITVMLFMVGTMLLVTATRFY